MFEKVGEVNAGKEVEVLIRVVSVVEDKIRYVGLEVVSPEDLRGASLCFIHSPILTFVTILDMFIGIPEVQTSYKEDPVIETSGGMTTIFSGIVIIGDLPKLVVVSL